MAGYNLSEIFPLRREVTIELVAKRTTMVGHAVGDGAFLVRRGLGLAILFLAAMASADAQFVGSNCTTPINFVWGQTVRGWTGGQVPSIGGACGSGGPQEALFFWFRAKITIAANYTVQVAVSTENITVDVYTSKNGSCTDLECAFQATAVENSGFISAGATVYLSVSTSLQGAAFAIQTSVRALPPASPPPPPIAAPPSGSGPSGGGGPQPPTGSCPGVPIVTLSGSATPEQVFAQTSADMVFARLPACNSSFHQSKPIAWFKFMTTEPTSYTFEVLDAEFDSVMHVFSGTNDACTSMTCVGWDDSSGQFGRLSRLRVSLLPSVIYFVAVHSLTDAVSHFDLAVTYGDLKADGNCPYAPLVLLDNNTSLVFEGTAEDMPISYLPSCPQVFSWPYEHVAWYKFMPLEGTSYTFEVTNASFDSVLHLAESSDSSNCQALSCISVNDNGGSDGRLSRFVLPLQARKVYFLAVHSRSGLPGNYTLAVDYGVKEVICFGAQELYLASPFNGTTEGITPTTLVCGLQQIPLSRLVWYYGRVAVTGEHSVQLVNATNPDATRITILFADSESSCDALECVDSGTYDDPFAVRQANVSARTIAYFAVRTDAQMADSVGGNFTLVLSGPSDGPSGSSGDGGPNVLLIVLLTCLLVPAALLALALLPLLVLRRRLQRPAVDENAVNEFLRKRNPPQGGMPIAVIITDIEGSTNLWEWNPAVMKRALAIHHNVVRALLPKYYGYESDTEGDSFTLVFHSASDALGWAMEAQRCLLHPLNLIESMPEMTSSPVSSPHKSMHSSTDSFGSRSDWPVELLSFGTGAEVRDEISGHVLYRGLRVRMGIHVGIPEGVFQHPNGRHHYKGEVMEMTKAVQDTAASGGQVIVSMLMWQSIGIQQPAVVCHHMGLHEVRSRCAFQNCWPEVRYRLWT
eukprot:jgi/Mesvir1/27797/Mv07480-RA.2